MYYTNSRVLENWYKSFYVEVITVKSKLLTLLIIVAVMLPFFASTVLAAPEVVVEITSPASNEEVVTKEQFSICGVCIYDETTIEFQYKNRESGEYEELLTTDGKASFKVGSNKLFGKSIKLKYKGEDNEIKVIAYTKATKDDPQVNEYTITFSDEKKKSNWFNDTWNWLVGPDETK